MKYKPHKNEFWNEKQTKELFQIHPFYNVLIEKRKIKHLSNIELLHELPLYDELSVVKISKIFRGYERSYKVEITEPKDPLVQLESSKSSVKDLFKDLLNEMKGFKYRITITVLLFKHKTNGDIEYSLFRVFPVFSVFPFYFNAATKTVINYDKNLFKRFYIE